MHAVGGVLGGMGQFFFKLFFEIFLPCLLYFFSFYNFLFESFKFPFFVSLPLFWGLTWVT